MDHYPEIMRAFVKPEHYTPSFDTKAKCDLFIKALEKCQEEYGLLSWDEALYAICQEWMVERQQDPKYKKYYPKKSD